MPGQRYVVGAVAAMAQCCACQSDSAGAVLYHVMWTADLILVSEGPQAMTSISKLRKSAFIQQNGQCYYCGCPMWTDSPESFAKRRNLSVKQARHLRCTAEHLKARQNRWGGCRGVSRCSRRPTRPFPSCLLRLMRTGH